MVNVGDKEKSRRTATAGAMVRFSPAVYKKIKEHVSGGQQHLSKGDLFTVSQIAGIMGAKRTHDLIPMCHPLALDHISVEFEMLNNESSISIEVKCSCAGKTGVEMEALTGASIAALTIYDMCKALDKSITIDGLRLKEKTGGKSDFCIKI